MGFVVKVSGFPSEPKWIGHAVATGPQRLVPRDEARVFVSEYEARREIQALQALVSGGIEFELEEQ
jgi:hypothetical protein